MPKTYNELYLETRRVFRERGISGYNLEARLLVAFTADKPMDRFLREKELYASDDIERELNALIERRLAGEPAAYITSGWEFYGLPFDLEPGILIPRMDTEVLADSAIRTIVANRIDARVLDLCTGSGCVGCAIAHKLPGVRAVLVDSDPKAAKLSRKNAIALGLAARVTCFEGDALGEPASFLGSFDLVVCNPPYIPTGDIASLDVSVREYEPIAALDGGEDGLKFYRAILKSWKPIIREGGALMFEVGINQAEPVKKLMRLAGLKSVGGVLDTGGIERVLYGRV